MPNNHSTAIVRRLWNYCNVLRDDGVSYGDYVEQLTYLLFLKMDDEQVRLLGKASAIPAGLDWQSLAGRSGDELESHYRHILAELGKGSGLIPTIFRKAQNKVQDPAKLRRLISLIDEETWVGLDIDVKGDIYEGLLEKNAQDIKSGAGQYFTPRPLIQALVDVTQPRPGQALCDPAAGTGGFLLAAYDYVAQQHGPSMDRAAWRHLRNEALHGWEIVDNTARLCVMNLYLHGIGVDGERSPIHVDDSLASDPGERFDLVLTNPPFGKKSSVTYVTDQGEIKREAQSIVRDDFWTSTSNKQLNFVQHVKTLLKVNGRAAVVVPDNVLFEGGAGETVRRKLLHECDVHTLLRLLTGIFCATASRPTCSSSTASRPASGRGPRRCGSTTCAPTRILPSSRTRSAAATWTSSWPAITPPTATSAPPPGRMPAPMAAGAPTPMSNSSRATRLTWTSSGCATTAWRTAPACPIPTCWRPRSWRTCGPRWRSSA
jgi:type I restriction enzyme M protein